MNECLYTKRGVMSLKKESDANVAVIPTIFFKANDEDIEAGYDWTPSSPVAGNRSMNLGAVKNKIPAPTGTINLNVEPKTIGHFLNGVVGVTSGVYFKVSSIANFAVGDTISNGSTGTGVITYIDTKRLVILASGVSGDWATADTVTNAGTGSATLSTFDVSVYGHAGKLPAELDNTFSIQVNYTNNAIRYMGCYFKGMDALSQADNIITSGFVLLAQSQLRHAKVTAQVTAGSGSKSIPLDQVQGFVATDSIKVYRPSTGAFLDFISAGVKTHAVGTVDVANLELDITNLETTLEIGDLVMLAPQTATLDTEDEFKWVGGSTTYLGADLDNLIQESFEEFSLIFEHDFEERHGANGFGMANRFPAKLCQKSIMAKGNLMMHYTDEALISRLRDTEARAIRYDTQACQIGVTGLYYSLSFDLPEVQFRPFSTPLSNDEIIDQSVDFEAIYNDDDGALATILLINDITTY